MTIQSYFLHDSIMIGIVPCPTLGAVVYVVTSAVAPDLALDLTSDLDLVGYGFGLGSGSILE